ncbi:cytochrome p450 domain-containing protein [Apiospora sp. TS-2023a]
MLLHLFFLELVHKCLGSLCKLNIILPEQQVRRTDYRHGAVTEGVKTAARGKSIYGDDADTFRPERWLEADAEKLKGMEETSRIIWGGPGRWECLGEKTARIMLDEVFFEESESKLFWRFDMVLADPTSPWKTLSCRLWVTTDMLADTHKFAGVQMSAV